MQSHEENDEPPPSAVQVSSTCSSPAIPLSQQMQLQQQMSAMSPSLLPQPQDHAQNRLAHSTGRYNSYLAPIDVHRASYPPSSAGRPPQEIASPGYAGGYPSPYLQATMTHPHSASLPMTSRTPTIPDAGTPRSATAVYGMYPPSMPSAGFGQNRMPQSSFVTNGLTYIPPSPMSSRPRQPISHQPYPQPLPLPSNTSSSNSTPQSATEPYDQQIAQASRGSHAREEKRRKQNKESSQRFRDRTKERQRQKQERLEFLETRVVELEGQMKAIEKGASPEDLVANKLIESLRMENQSLKEALQRAEEENQRLMTGSPPSEPNRQSFNVSPRSENGLLMRPYPSANHASGLPSAGSNHSRFLSTSSAGSMALPSPSGMYQQPPQQQQYAMQASPPYSAGYQTQYSASMDQSSYMRQYQEQHLQQHQQQQQAQNYLHSPTQASAMIASPTLAPMPQDPDGLGPGADSDYKESHPGRPELNSERRSPS